mmetsp:Transcript_105360/g.339837  ORF Transcript_105360/g.339837 Transcript_105360/m.339837 type:complete len:316 (-) Transcript_105360:422-1369(-)
MQMAHWTSSSGSGGGGARPKPAAAAASSSSGASKARGGSWPSARQASARPSASCQELAAWGMGRQLLRLQRRRPPQATSASAAARPRLLHMSSCRDLSRRLPTASFAAKSTTLASVSWRQPLRSRHRSRSAPGASEAARSSCNARSVRPAACARERLLSIGRAVRYVMASAESSCAWRSQTMRKRGHWAASICTPESSREAQLSTQSSRSRGQRRPWHQRFVPMTPIFLSDWPTMRAGSRRDSRLSQRCRSPKALSPDMGRQPLRCSRRKRAEWRRRNQKQRSLRSFWCSARSSRSSRTCPSTPNMSSVSHGRCF